MHDDEKIVASAEKGLNSIIQIIHIIHFFFALTFFRSMKNVGVNNIIKLSDSLERFRAF